MLWAADRSLKPKHIIDFKYKFDLDLTRRKLL